MTPVGRKLVIAFKVVIVMIMSRGSFERFLVKTMALKTGLFLQFLFPFDIRFCYDLHVAVEFVPGCYS